MHIGIIVYSRTGHTLSVAKKLQGKLTTAGHTATLEQLETVGPVSLGATSARLERIPAIAPYEGLVFGTPVRGGMPAAPMTSFLEQVGSLSGKQVGCLVTGFFPAGWGRDQTVARMREICESKGAMVSAGESVGWFSLRRRRRIAEVIDSLSGCFARVRPAAPPTTHLLSEQSS